MTGSSALAMAVVVVSFNTRGVLESCLESVAAAAPSGTVVVDNGSTDGSIELVRRRFPSVRLITNDENRGYGHAANQGIAACSTPAVLLLNSDTVLDAGALHALGRYFAERRFASNSDTAIRRSARFSSGRSSHACSGRTERRTADACPPL